jgi:hypothetical protein
MESDLEEKKASPELRDLFIKLIALKNEFKNHYISSEESISHHIFEKLHAIIKEGQ